jgi:hypothetical protein
MVAQGLILEAFCGEPGTWVSPRTNISSSLASDDRKRLGRLSTTAIYDFVERNFQNDSVRAHAVGKDDD